MATLIMIRHGQSLYNQKNLFTGWTDIDLSVQGEKEAKKAGERLKQEGIYPDICFTSWLKRAIHTAQLLLREMKWEQIDCLKSWKLNERHYGTWQKQNKEHIKQEVGEKRFIMIRRGYDTPPPPLPSGDARLPQNKRQYQHIDRTLLPRSESLKDTKIRTLNYFYDAIAPQLAKDKTVLVCAHGNSLRALMMALEKLSEKEIVEREIPTGTPILYHFDTSLQLIEKKVLTLSETSSF